MPESIDLLAQAASRARSLSNSRNNSAEGRLSRENSMSLPDGLPNGGTFSNIASTEQLKEKLLQFQQPNSSTSTQDNAGTYDQQGNYFHPMSSGEMFGFSVGHYLNDFQATLWFTYLLRYLETTRSLPPSSSGIVMTTGQVCDAIMTPIAGWLSDGRKGSVGWGGLR
jgi:hypothetical protein